jgi:hypothetical protein
VRIFLAIPYLRGRDPEITAKLLFNKKQRGVSTLWNWSTYVAKLLKGLEKTASFSS